MIQDKPTGTGITQIASKRESGIAPLMSYTAVTTHGKMATAFVDHIIKYCQKLIPDHNIDTEDLIAICQTALEQEGESVRLIEGKHLRGRISEQLARTKRYGEIFAMIAIKLKTHVPDSSYDAIIDVLRERLRKSDMIFTFKNRVMLILPYIDESNTQALLQRVSELANASFNHSPIREIQHLCFPSPKLSRSSQVLDWAEDQLR